MLLLFPERKKLFPVRIFSVSRRRDGSKRFLSPLYPIRDAGGR
ncbi:hypothetical protein ATPR_1085 [Acetobacter tropicalis NBRC 101654]|uniref:Uncharacterized protein n=1 Tax=Acetobacter tropicalis NBRC 101654 TaxID=749388 RepID=F7VCI6_9PROT|nr:hypothetical protein ATPR_1085 [Acetobacter tropicalis NBRC 101654]